MMPLPHARRVTVITRAGLAYRIISREIFKPFYTARNISIPTVLYIAPCLSHSANTTVLSLSCEMLTLYTAEKPHRVAGVFPFGLIMEFPS